VALAIHGKVPVERHFFHNSVCSSKTSTELYRMNRERQISQGCQVQKNKNANLCKILDDFGYIRQIFGRKVVKSKNSNNKF